MWWPCPLRRIQSIRRLHACREPAFACASAAVQAPAIVCVRLTKGQASKDSSGRDRRAEPWHTGAGDQAVGRGPGAAAAGDAVCARRAGLVPGHW